MKRLLALLAALTAALVLLPRLSAGETIPAKEAAARVAAGQAVLIDVREAAEWQETGVAAPAVLLPLSDLRGERTQWKAFLAAHPGKELILYCRSGHRAGIAADILAKEGFKTANAGAFQDWAAAGLPVRQAPGQ